jgi:hypothetical protein
MPVERSDRVKQHSRTFVVLPGHISVILLSNSGLVPLADLSYRLHLGSDRVIEGTTDGDGFLSHADVPVGDYRMELEGYRSEFTVPSMPTDVERYPLRVPGYMLFTDDTPEESLPEYEESEELDLNDIDEAEWDDLTDE